MCDVCFGGVVGVIGVYGRLLRVLLIAGGLRRLASWRIVGCVAGLSNLLASFVPYMFCGRQSYLNKKGWPVCLPVRQ